MIKLKNPIKAQSLKYCICVLLLFAIGTEGLAQAQFVKTSAQLTNLKKLQATVESNPENLKAHESFLEDLFPDDPYLKSQYATWLKRFPKSFAVPFSIGKYLINYLYPEGYEYLQKAVKLKPKSAEAWFLLGSNTGTYGSSLSQEYLANAKIAEPENSRYAFYYASSFKDTDSFKYDSLLMAVVFRFPASDEAPLALTNLALNSSNESEKIAFFEQLMKRYSTNLSKQASYGLETYFNYMLENTPQKAFEIALNMTLEPKVNHYQWSNNLILARTVRDVKTMMDQNKPSIVLEMLNRLPTYYRNNEKYTLAKIEAVEAYMNSKAAYDTLSLFYAKRPGTKSRTALLAYGKKVGKDENQVDLDIQNMREASARPANDFLLEQYTANDRTSLAANRGKVILLSYWFPACGPCRAEFPHIESAIKKFENSEFRYLGINIDRKQDAWVLPFIESTRYSFIPLKEDKFREKGNLDNKGSAPVNFLIDQKGRIMFSHFRIDEKNTDMLELMIKELIEQNSN